MRFSKPESSGASGPRRTGNSPTHNPPKGGCVVGESNSPSPDDERRQWVRENLPTCAELAAETLKLFPGSRLAYASENGHVIGKRSPEGVKLSETLVGPMVVRKAAK